VAFGEDEETRIQFILGQSLKEKWIPNLNFRKPDTSKCAKKHQKFAMLSKNIRKWIFRMKLRSKFSSFITLKGNKMMIG
jgi:hypothetical protein